MLAAMSRRKQVVPKRRADARQRDTPDFSNGDHDAAECISPQHAHQEPSPARTSKRHGISHYCAEEPSTFELPSHESVYALAEFIVATRRRDDGGNPAEPVAGSSAQQLTVRVVPRLMNDCADDDEDDRVDMACGIALTWSVGDEAGLQHKVWR